jgi:hypothetical protein
LFAAASLREAFCGAVDAVDQIEGVCCISRRSQRSFSCCLGRQ